MIGAVKASLQRQLFRMGQAFGGDRTVSEAKLVSVIHRNGFTPSLIFDIGVANGTPWLYEAFGKAKYHLVDPTRESLPHMRKIASTLNAEVHNFALGSSEGAVEIRTRDTILHATILTDVTDPQLISTYNVQMYRFDQKFSIAERMVLVKIDVEGYELEVLRGMSGQLGNIDIVLIEISLNSLYAGGPELADIVGFLSGHNFALFDIYSLTRRPYDTALHQLDAAFVKKDSQFRVKKWS